MTTLAIEDLSIGKDLDRSALATIIGRGTYHGSWSNSYSGWSSTKRLAQQYVGTTYHDGYRVREYNEVWRKQRTHYQTWRGKAYRRT